MKRVAIIDYGMGNLDSVARAVQECGGEPQVTGQPRDLERASAIILPGVGAFAMSMRTIRGLGIEEALNEQVLAKGIPFLGLCLGMQLLAKRGDEGGPTDGLGWIEGEVTRLKPDGPGARIPHIGWNEVDLVQDSPLFRGIPSGKDFYFVHSYSVRCEDRSQVLACTPYCGGFVSAVGKGNVYGVQFHPEKSQKVGFAVLRNFLSL